MRTRTWITCSRVASLITYASRIPAPPIWTDEPLGTDEKMERHLYIIYTSATPLDNIFIEIRTIRVGVGRSSSHAKIAPLPYDLHTIHYVECNLYRDVISVFSGKMKGLQSPHQHRHAGLIVPSTLNVKMPNEPRFFLGRTWMSNRIDRRFRFYSSPKKRELSKPFSNRYQLFNCSQHSIFYVTHSLAQTSSNLDSAKRGSAGISEFPKMAFPSVFGP